MRWTEDDHEDRVLLPGPGLARAGHGPGHRRGGARGDGGVRRAAARRRGLDLRRLCFDTPLEEMVETEVQQPALVATSLAMLAALRARGIEADYVIGHSVGEFAALAAAKSVGDPGDDRARARARPGDGRGGARAARLDGGDPRARRRGRRATSAGRSSACGRRTTTARARSSSRASTTPSTSAARAAEEEGARRTVKLKVSGAFHSPLVARAAERLRPAVEAVKFGEPQAPFMSTVTARFEEAQRMGALLVDQLTAPVRFTQAASELVQDGVADVRRGRARATCSPGW